MENIVPIRHGFLNVFRLSSRHELRLLEYFVFYFNDLIFLYFIFITVNVIMIIVIITLVVIKLITVIAIIVSSF